MEIISNCNFAVMERTLLIVYLTCLCRITASTFLTLAKRMQTGMAWETRVMKMQMVTVF